MPNLFDKNAPTQSSHSGGPSPSVTENFSPLLRALAAAASIAAASSANAQELTPDVSIAGTFGIQNLRLDLNGPAGGSGGIGAAMNQLMAHDQAFEDMRSRHVEQIPRMNNALTERVQVFHERVSVEVRAAAPVVSQSVSNHREVLARAREALPLPSASRAVIPPEAFTTLKRADLLLNALKAGTAAMVYRNPATGNAQLFSAASKLRGATSNFKNGASSISQLEWSMREQAGVDGKAPAPQESSALWFSKLLANTTESIKPSVVTGEGNPNLEVPIELMESNPVEALGRLNELATAMETNLELLEEQRTALETIQEVAPKLQPMLSAVKEKFDGSALTLISGPLAMMCLEVARSAEEMIAVSRRSEIAAAERLPLVLEAIEGQRVRAEKLRGNIEAIVTHIKK